MGEREPSSSYTQNVLNPSNKDKEKKEKRKPSKEKEGSHHVQAQQQIKGIIQQDELVKLNVGGVKYITAKSTLFSKGENFFTLLVENDEGKRVPSLRDDEGYIFVDRDGELFRHVLNYLRTGKLFKPDNLPLAQLELELDFYQVKRAVDDRSELRKENLINTKSSGDFATFSQILDRWRSEASEWFETYKHLKLKDISAAANN